MVKARSHPATIAGAMTGRVTSRRTCQGRSPKSRAASSIAISASIIRLWTTVVTKTIEKVTWASVIVVTPRLAGLPIHFAIRMKAESEAMPVMGSGMTSGAVTRPESGVRAWQRWERASAMLAHGAEDGGKRGAECGDPEQEEGCVDDLVGVEQRAVPAGREATPDRGEARVVEREDDHRQDRHIEEGKADAHHGDEKDRAAVHGAPLRAGASARPSSQA